MIYALNEIWSHIGRPVAAVYARGGMLFAKRLKVGEAV